MLFSEFKNILLVLLLVHQHFLPCYVTMSFDVQNGYLCIRPEFVRNQSVTSLLHCSMMCSDMTSCRAFTMSDGPCQLFVFDKCSKSVRDCSCSRRGQLFVKKQPGLQAGQLCPTGYGDDLCGVKYKLHFGMGLWGSSRQKCESESGLVIMADVTDATEMSRVDQIYNNRAGGVTFWLGGFQPAGSPEPAGGWYWVACNIPTDGSLWGSGEPNNNQNRENVIGRWSSHDKLSDFWDSSLTPGAVLCECLSPFD